MKLTQHKNDPPLQIRMKTQYDVRCFDDKNKMEEIEWCTGKIILVSNGSDMRNATRNGPRFHKEGGAANAECAANASKGVEISYLIAKFVKKNIYSVRGTWLAIMLRRCTAEKYAYANTFCSCE